MMTTMNNENEKENEHEHDPEVQGNQGIDISEQRYLLHQSYPNNYKMVALQAHQQRMAHRIT